MELTKKRKRERELPRIIYDAATRTFDRLFKEDSLEGMKDVVRTNLVSLPRFRCIFLNYARENRLTLRMKIPTPVDDDFEAFHSSAYSTSVARVKVVLGSGSGPVLSLPHEMQLNEIEPISQSKKKRRKKRKSDSLESSGDTSPIIPSEGASSENPPPVKKRRVSFAEPSADLQAVPEVQRRRNGKHHHKVSETRLLTPRFEAEKTKKKREKLAVAIAEEDAPMVNDAQPTSDGEKKKKKKKKKATDATSEADTHVVRDLRLDSVVEEARKNEERSTDKGLTAESTDGTQAKKSKKRPNPSTSTEPINGAKSGPGEKSSYMSTVPEQAADEDDIEVQRPAKKSKKKYADDADTSVAVAGKAAPLIETAPRESEDVLTAKSRRSQNAILNNAILSDETSPPEPAEIPTVKQAKKSRRKSDAQLSDKQPEKVSAEKSTESSSKPKVVEMPLKLVPLLSSQRQHFPLKRVSFSSTIHPPAHVKSKQALKGIKEGAETAKESEQSRPVGLPLLDTAGDRDKEKSQPTRAEAKLQKKRTRRRMQAIKR
ncbi:hypothetical protein BDZ97DRAFT_1916477 [Flammula alnicola]|nr:hypothetical protein BDZ97DRAFT_1916477 [Flammula alnicola]